MGRDVAVKLHTAEEVLNEAFEEHSAFDYWGPHSQAIVETVTRSGENEVRFRIDNPTPLEAIKAVSRLFPEYNIAVAYAHENPTIGKTTFGALKGGELATSFYEAVVPHIETELRAFIVENTTAAEIQRRTLNLSNEEQLKAHEFYVQTVEELTQKLMRELKAHPLDILSLLEAENHDDFTKYFKPASV